MVWGEFSKRKGGQPYRNGLSATASKPIVSGKWRGWKRSRALALSCSDWLTNTNNWPIPNREDQRSIHAKRELGTAGAPRLFHSAMMDPFNRAERYRARAGELRITAQRMREPDTKDALLAIADGLDHHARNLDAAGVKFHWGHRASRRAEEPVAD